MPKFRIEVELDYDGVTGIERADLPTSKSHLNALMREAVYIQVNDAMTQYGFKSKINRVRKVGK